MLSMMEGEKVDEDPLKDRNAVAVGVTTVEIPWPRKTELMPFELAADDPLPCCAVELKTV